MARTLPDAMPLYLHGIVFADLVADIAPYAFGLVYNCAVFYCDS
jgi:hypothetical protein